MRGPSSAQRRFACESRTSSLANCAAFSGEPAATAKAGHLATPSPRISKLQITSELSDSSRISQILTSQDSVDVERSKDCKQLVFAWILLHTLQLIMAYSRLSFNQGEMVHRPKAIKDFKNWFIARESGPKTSNDISWGLTIAPQLIDFWFTSDAAVWCGLPFSKAQWQKPRFKWALAKEKNTRSCNQKVTTNDQLIDTNTAFFLEYHTSRARSAILSAGMGLAKTWGGHEETRNCL